MENINNNHNIFSKKREWYIKNGLKIKMWETQKLIY